jgi:hypothetical protein
MALDAVAHDVLGIACLLMPGVPGRGGMANGDQSAYTPEFKDWIFHAILPCASYLKLTACALEASHFAE